MSKPTVTREQQNPHGYSPAPQLFCACGFPLDMHGAKKTCEWLGAQEARLFPEPAVSNHEAWEQGYEACKLDYEREVGFAAGVGPEVNPFPKPVVG